jgi:enoyl-CoA hydratase/carnithine racemase
MSEQNVIVERVGNRLDIVLNRPDRKNAITQQLAVELRDAFLNVPSDIGCILLSGSGGAFRRLRAEVDKLADSVGMALTKEFKAFFWSCWMNNVQY